MEPLEPKSLVQIITEKEFLPLVQDACIRIFKIHNSFRSILEQQSDVTKKFYSNLIQQADFFESFLDEYGARENKTWFYFSECVASVRNLGFAAFYIKHFLDRYPYYNLRDSEEFKNKFLVESQKSLDFLNQSILKLFEELIKVGRANHLEFPEESIDGFDFSEVESDKRLPRNISEDEVKDEEERIVDLCEKVRNVAEMMKEIKISPTDDINQLKKFIPTNIDEKKTRLFTNMIHSVQSDFDTYVKNTLIEQSHPKLKNLRGYISLTLHLLEVVLWLCHFYERHEDEIRKGESKTKISALVSKNQLLDRIVNFAFYYALYYTQEAHNLSEELFSRFVKTVRYELPIPKPLGFHARPSTYISLIVRQYDSEAFMVVDGEKYNTKSVMSLLQAGGAVADKGYRSVIFEGDKRVLDDIKILAKYNYCEEKEIPPELGYLRKANKTN